MKIFLKILFFIIISILTGAFSFYISLFFAWGGAISVNTVLTIGVSSSILIFSIFFISFLKNDDPFKVILFIILILLILYIPFYLYFIKDNSKFYKYETYPCKGQILKSDYNLTILTYAGTSMDGFDSLTKYNLEDNYYYNLIKKNTGHTFKKTYPIGSEWTIEGLYHHTRNNVSYFLLKSKNEEIKAWLYMRNFNYEKCKIDFYYYKDRGVGFKTYELNGEKEEVIITSS